MDIQRTEFPVDRSRSVLVRFKIALDKRVEVKIYPRYDGIYGQAEVSISTATLTIDDMPSYVAMLSMAYAEVVRLNALYAGKVAPTGEGEKS